MGECCSLNFKATNLLYKCLHQGYYQGSSAYKMNCSSLHFITLLFYSWRTKITFSSIVKFIGKIVPYKLLCTAILFILSERLQLYNADRIQKIGFHSLMYKIPLHGWNLIKKRRLVYDYKNLRDDIWFSSQKNST